MTGSAIAIPLLGAGSASAAEGLNWDRVAECESGGSWSQNSGNGYYGGLQLTQEDWEKYGGLDFASSPDQASRGQQIAVAEKILADQGVGAWRTCGLLAGLDQDAPPADVDTGVADGSTSDETDARDASESRDPSASSPSSSPSVSPSATAGGEETPEASTDESGKPDNSAEPTAGSDRDADAGSGASSSPSSGPEGGESDKSGQSGDASAATEGTGRHRGASAGEDEERDRASESSGRHASRGLNAWGGTVGDSSDESDGGGLSSVTDSLAADDGWRALHVVNEQLIGGGPGIV
ncbi:transglycosylase family protein [Streptomyces toyocaensis]|uniref:transglycosylase family protein n=1 Tax=Streptomyces toyocaensis TaxID=55952 RepID=UPI003F4D4B9C